MTKKIIIPLIGILVLIVSTVFLVSRGLQEADKNTAPIDDTIKRIAVTATIYPWAFVAERVGGDRVTVTVTTPAGAEPHDYEPTPRDIADAKNSKIFILNGLGMDAWAERILPEMQSAGIQTVKISNLTQTSEDPHIWLNLDVMNKAASKLAEILSQVDPTNKDFYTVNAEQLKTDLALMDDKYKNKLQNCDLRFIIVSHEAFGYLAKRYDINAINIAGLSAEEEPSAKHLSEITDLVKEKGIRYIFFETLVSSKLSEVIASETKAETLVLNPIEGLSENEISEGKDYLMVMADNLVNLQRAMLCH
ncbi:MAG: zinc ABC transporter substrate-binding protein [Patescibacteria group bacterium]